MSMNLAQKLTSGFSIFAAILLAGCGGGGGGGGGPPPNAPANAAVMGLWTITETSKTSSNPNCQPPASPLSTDLLFISQSGNNLTMMFGVSAANPTFGADGGLYTGTIASGAVSLSGSTPEDGGAGMETDTFTATVAASCNTLTGTGTFSVNFTNPALVCTGTAQFSGTRTVGSGCTGTITPTAVAEQGPPIAHNTPAAAQTITLSSAISGTVGIPGPGADDWYRLVLPATTPVTMSLTGGPSGQDIDLVLVAADGTTVIAISGSATSSESLSRSLAAGTYFIVVSPFSVGPVANYTLVVQ